VDKAVPDQEGFVQFLKSIATQYAPDVLGTTCVRGRKVNQEASRTVTDPASLLAQVVEQPIRNCVFRSIVTDRFGIVTAEFGNVTDCFGDVTGGVLKAA
jgi:hypothetical protein